MSQYLGSVCAVHEGLGPVPLVSFSAAELGGQIGPALAVTDGMVA
jgi:hypothetical protein